jgi:maleate isomerase
VRPPAIRSATAGVFGSRGRVGVVVPANNSVLEPELWSRLPPGLALYATRILARGDLTPAAVRRMEGLVDRAVEELAATIVDVILYADMVTTFIMDAGWSARRSAELAQHAGVPCVTAWTALADALQALGVRRIALGTPYPRAVHALAPPFFERAGYTLSDAATLDILAMTDVPRVSPARVRRLVAGLDRTGADAVVLLATDLPTFAVIETLEAETRLPVLTSNQTLLWRALRACGRPGPISGLGRLLRRPGPPGGRRAPLRTASRGGRPPGRRA